MKLSKTNNKLAVERLESRCLMAGNVTVAIREGNLYVDGDNLSNSVSIESAGPNTVQVLGVDNPVGTSTRINGSPNGARYFSGFAGDIFVRMRAGNDRVHVTNMVAPRHLFVDLGAGNDLLVAGRDMLFRSPPSTFGPTGPLYVQGYLRAFGGSGNDEIDQADVQVHGSGLVDLGIGNDSFRIDPYRDGDSYEQMAGIVEYFGSLTVQTGTGVDTADITGLGVGNNFLLDKPSGQLDAALTSVRVDSYADIFTEEGADDIVLTDVDVYRDLTIASGAGADLIDVARSAADRMFIDSGWEEDDVLVANVALRVLDVRLGQGDDYLDLLSVDADAIYAKGDDGNDLFIVRDTQALDAYFYGDAGFDTFRTSSTQPNSIARLRRFSFERQ